MQLGVASLGQCTCTVVITDIGCCPYLRYNIKQSFYFDYSQTQRFLNTCQKKSFEHFSYSVMRSSGGYISLGIQVHTSATNQKPFIVHSRNLNIGKIHKRGHLLELLLNMSVQNLRGARVLLGGSQTPLSSSVNPATFANKPRGENVQITLTGRSIVHLEIC